MIKVIQWLNAEQRDKVEKVIKYIEDNFDMPLSSVHDSITMKTVKFMFRDNHAFFISFEMLRYESLEEIITCIKDIPGDWK